MTAQRTRPEDLAGRWLTRFFIDHLAGERAASPRTIASYRDAIKLLLTWFKTTERIPPEKLRVADIDRPRVLRFLDWLETERGCSEATRNQRLAVIKSFCRYTAIEQPDHLEQNTRSSRSGRRRARARSSGTQETQTRLRVWTRISSATSRVLLCAACATELPGSASRRPGGPRGGRGTRATQGSGRCWRDPRAVRINAGPGPRRVG